MKTSTKEAAYSYKRFQNRLQTRRNPLIKNLCIQTIPGNLRHGLKTNWCHDLLQNQKKCNKIKR